MILKRVLGVLRKSSNSARVGGGNEKWKAYIQIPAFDMTLCKKWIGQDIDFENTIKSYLL
jgi:hypothetical protein